MTKKTLALIALAPLSVVAHGQASLTNSGYTQNFNSLTVFGDPDKNNLAGGWTDNSTLGGWYKTHIDYGFDAGYHGDAIYLSTGTSSVQGMYSVGEQFDGERSLGMFSPFKIASGNATEVGLRLTNNTGSVVTGLNVSFVEEHWTKTIQPGRAPHHNTFSYLVGGTSLTDAGYTADADLDVVAAPADGGTAFVDGNLAENQRLVTATISGISLAAGQDIFLKWTDWNQTISTHLDGSFTAMDDLSITAAAAPVPEPTTMAALAIGAGALLRRRKKAAK